MAFCRINPKNSDVKVFFGLNKKYNVHFRTKSRNIRKLKFESPQQAMLALNFLKTSRNYKVPDKAFRKLKKHTWNTKVPSLLQTPETSSVAPTLAPKI